MTDGPWTSDARMELAKAWDQLTAKDVELNRLRAELQRHIDLLGPARAERVSLDPPQD